MLVPLVIISERLCPSQLTTYIQLGLRTVKCEALFLIFWDFFSYEQHVREG